MSTFSTVLTVAQLTIRETQRRRILWVAVFMGMAFLIMFGLGFHYIYRELEEEISMGFMTLDFQATLANFLRFAGLYAVYFLVIAMAALISANSISGEIESHTMETIVTKPLPRWSVVLGKWLGFALLVTVYTLFMAGGIILIVYFRSGNLVQNAPAGLAVMVLGGLVMLSISIAGGTRLSTLANGALAFMLYGLAFIGGWVEQIGALFRNETAVDLGILSSLIMPADVLWRHASSLFQPLSLTDLDMAAPFLSLSQPHERMLIYAVLFSLGLLALAMWLFTRRDL